MARNEFVRVFLHPLTPLIILLVSVSAILNVFVGVTTDLDIAPGDYSLYYSLSQIFNVTSKYIGFIAVFTGVMSLAEERKNHSINIILSKPLFRKDLIAGKLLGLNCYLLTVIAFSILFTGLALVLFYFRPTDSLDYVAKIAIYVLIAFVYASLNIAIALLISIIFKDLLICVSMAMAYIFIEDYVGWWRISPFLDNFSPVIAMSNLHFNKAANLQNTTTTASQWISANATNLCFMIAATVLISLIAMAVFTRSDNT